MAPQHRRRIALVAALAAVGGALLIGLGRRGGGRAPAAPDAVQPAQAAPEEPAASPAPRVPPVAAAGGPGEGTRRDPATMPPGGLARATADDYRRRARYPRSSQPLAPGEDPIVRDREISPITARGLHGDDPALTVFPLLPGFESPDPVVLLAYLTMGERRIAAREIRATLASEDLQPLAEVEYRDDGEGGDAAAGDGLYTAVVQPGPDPARALARSYLVKVRAVTLGDEERLAATSFLYSAPHARLTGRYRDAVVDGSLRIDAEVEVLAPGRFHLEGTLYTPDGAEQIAWAQAAAELPPGVHWMSLPVYGVILRERGIDGPYLVRHLALSTTSAMPNAKNRLVENAHMTRAYRADSFTDRPFGDPGLLEAAERIERDQATLGRLEAGG